VTIFDGRPVDSGPETTLSRLQGRIPEHVAESTIKKVGVVVVKIKIHISSPDVHQLPTT
jgi:hypothetical protein